VLAVVFVLPVQGVPLVTGVLIVTPITVLIAYPASGTIVVVAVAIFRLAPTPITIVVALDANAMVVVRVAALVRARDGRGRL
jgi:hypothetical protein